ncbi:AI-2E family transporter [Pararhodospirillum oryzae]|uniref:AI-2E family transporter n=1 Tax=Pararhodospirillum oryzae TaxID=478448 RepID=A0A512H8R1_9PROT|nr:AI-2E family transporter [Pararhodospirillum oryzae]GEO81808.1 AI-2E family transporter [Pararhodospirillum oryzae]
MTRDQQIRFWAVGVVVTVALLYVLRSVLAPFVAGMAAAYMLDPLADRLERLRISRLGATIIITLGFFLCLALGLLVLLPLLQGQIAAFIKNVPGYTATLVDKGQALLGALQATLGPERMGRLTSGLESTAVEAAKWLVALITDIISGGAALVGVVSVLVITPVITFYMLRDWDRMVGAIDGWLPRPYAPVIRTQMEAINQTIAGFIRGQSTVCLALGSYYAIGLTLAGLDLGLVVGLVSGVLSFIPYVGTITGFVSSLALALAQFESWPRIAVVVAIFVSGQVIEGNVLTPKLVGDRVGLHPVWVIFALLAGGGLFGFVGVLLAVPVAAVIGVLVRFFLSQYLASPLYSGETGASPRLAPPAGSAPSSPTERP